MKLKKVKQLLAMALSAAMIVGSVPVSAGGFEPADFEAVTGSEMLNDPTALTKDMDYTIDYETENLTVKTNDVGSTLNGKNNLQYSVDYTTNNSNPTWTTITNNEITLNPTNEVSYVYIKEQDNQTDVYKAEIPAKPSLEETDITVTKTSESITLSSTKQNLKYKYNQNNYADLSTDDTIDGLTAGSTTSITFQIKAVANKNFASDEVTMNVTTLYTLTKLNISESTFAYGKTLGEILTELTKDVTVTESGENNTNVDGKWSVTAVDSATEPIDMNKKLGVSDSSYTLQLKFDATDTTEKEYEDLEDVKASVTINQADSDVAITNTDLTGVTTDSSITFAAKVTVKNSEPEAAVSEGKVTFTVTKKVVGEVAQTANSELFEATVNDNGVAEATTAWKPEEGGNYTVKAVYTDQNGNYADSNSVETVINVTDTSTEPTKTDISKAIVTLTGVDKAEYTGSAIVPETVTVKLTAEDQEPINAQNYTVTYEKNGEVVAEPTDAGTYTVKVAAKTDSEYTGEASTTYEITQATVPAVVLEPEYTYPASVTDVRSIPLGLPEYVKAGIVASKAATDSIFSNVLVTEDGKLNFTFADTTPTGTDGTITLKFTNQLNYKFSNTTDVVVTIIPSSDEVTEVTPSITETATKEYDGTKAVEDGDLSIKLEGLKVGADVTATATFEYDTADVGTGKTINIGDVKLIGKDAAMYQLKEGVTLTAKGDITAYAPTVTLTADGTTLTAAVSKPEEGDALTGSVEFYKDSTKVTTLPVTDGSAEYADAADGTYYAKYVKGTEETNYTDSANSATVQVGSTGTGGGGNVGGGGGSTVTPPETETPTPTPEVTPTPNPEPTPEVKDPTTAETETVKPDENGNASVEADAVKDAIADAKAEAEKNGTTENGIAVTVPVANDGEKVNVTIDAAAADALVEAAAKKLEIKAEDMMAAGLDAALLKTLVTEGAGADIVLSVEKVKDAPAAVGKRPVYDVKLGYANADGITWIGDLGTNKIQLKFPYVPAQSEAHEKLYGVHIGEDGKVNWLKVCDYNADTKEVSFETTHFSLYGVAYLDLDATPVKVEKKDTKSVTINWASADLAEGYTVWYHKEGETENKRKVVNGADITTWTQARLTAGTKYFYAVRPWVKTQDGYVFGDETSFVRGTTKPQAAKIKTVTAKDGKVKVALAGEAAGAEKYSMCYSTDADFEDFAVGVRTSYTTRTFKNTLEPGTYYVKVKSYRDLGNGKRVYGEWSNAKKVTVK